MSQLLARRSFLTALTVLAVVGCGTSGTTETVSKSGAQSLRHELEPLAKRLPMLADAKAASWASGTLGDDRVPGPSLYWIDAVVELDDATYAEAQKIGGEVSPLPQDLHELVLPEVPDGEFVWRTKLDEFFSEGSWKASAFLHREQPVVVLLVKGE